MFTTDDWLDLSYDNYAATLKRKQVPDLDAFKKDAQVTLDGMRDADLQMFVEDFWREEYERLGEIDDEDCDGVGLPWAFWERDYWKPFVVLAVWHGFFESVHEALVYRWLYCRHLKLGDYLNEIVKVCLYTEPIVDLSGLDDYFYRRSLLPRVILTSQPALF